MGPIGARLKKLRLEKGISLEEVQRKTKIHLNILKDIEEDALLNFNSVYIKGFLKIYCKFLNVDHKDYLSDYQPPQTPIYLARTVDSPPALWQRISLKPFMSKLKNIKIKKALTGLLIFLIIIALFNIGKGISSRPSRKHDKAVLTARTAEDKKEGKVQAAKSYDAAAIKEIRLSIFAMEDCFINLKSDGHAVFRGILAKGRSETWQAKDRIEFSLGNAGVAELEVNGKRISSLGRRGEAVKNISITREGLSIVR